MVERRQMKSDKSKKRRRVQLGYECNEFVEESIHATENEHVAEIGISRVVNIKERSFDFDFQMSLEYDEMCSDDIQVMEEKVDQEFADEEISVLQESVIEALNDIVPDVLETQKDITCKDYSNEPL